MVLGYEGSLCLRTLSSGDYLGLSNAYTASVMHMHGLRCGSLIRQLGKWPKINFLEFITEAPIKKKSQQCCNCSEG